MPQNPLLQSPTAIPPRTSSSAGQHSGSNTTVRNPTTPSENHWLGQTDTLGQFGYSQAAGGSSHSAGQNPQPLHRRMSSSATSTGARRLTTAAFRASAPLPAMPSPFLSTPQPALTPPDPNRYAHEDLDFTTSRRTWSEDKDRIVRGPFDYLNAQPGKDFRTQLISAFNDWLEVPDDSMAPITNIVGMLHTASLLVDDVEDSASLRRGLPVAHNIFGVAQTINSANYIYFCTLKELQKLHNHQEALAIYAEELANLHRGQGMDLFWRDTLTCPTEEDYLEMVGNKTGGLFRLGIKLMQAESRTGVDCIPLANLIGLIFQIRDDYQNLSSQEYSDNKGLCEDLTEGKFSFPIIHSIRSNPTDMQLVNILGQKTTDAEVKRYAVAYMESTGSFEYSRRVVGVLIERARKLAEEMDEGRGKSAGVHKILDLLSI